MTPIEANPSCHFRVCGAPWPADSSKSYVLSSGEVCSGFTRDLRAACLLLIRWTESPAFKGLHGGSPSVQTRFAKILASTRIASVIRGPYHETRVPSIK